MASILAKLEIHSQMQALVFAVRHGIVEILEIFLESPRIGGIQRFAMSLTHIASSQCTMLARKDLHKCLRAHEAEDHVRGTRSKPSHAAMSRRPCTQDHDT